VPKTLTMTFRRSDYTQRGCLEYSWVPEGKRRVIVLNPGTPQHVQTDTLPDDVVATHVQVYVLNNGRAGTVNWQFPPGPPRPGLIVDALVDVYAPAKARGTVYYAGGATVSDDRPLGESTQKCPSGL